MERREKPEYTRGGTWQRIKPSAASWRLRSQSLLGGCPRRASTPACNPHHAQHRPRELQLYQPHGAILPLRKLPGLSLRGLKTFKKKNKQLTPEHQDTVKTAPPSECWEQKGFAPDGFADLTASTGVLGFKRLRFSWHGPARGGKGSRARVLHAAALDWSLSSVSAQ